MGTKVIALLKYLFNCTIMLIFPFKEECVICNGIVAEDTYICALCESKIKYCKDSFKLEKNGKVYTYFSLAYYSKGISELILRLKYKSDFQCAEVLGEKMAKLILDKGIKVEFITFVPSTPQSLKQRGYNQSKLLAKVVGRSLNLKVISSLEKIRETKDQIGLNEESRWENITGSYRLIKHKSVENKKILLVDDVMTTGATSVCCVEELKKGGASNIFVLTAAKSKL
jgi:competence protein ComFC